MATYEEKLHMLEEAQKSINDSNMFWEWYQEFKEEADYRMCCEFNERAKGILIAYKICTGRKVYPLTHSIQEEIERVMLER